MFERVENLTFVDLINKTGLTQEQLAEKIGVRRATISDWKNKKAPPRLYPWQYAKLLELLGCTPEEFAKACLQEIEEEAETIAA